MVELAITIGTLAILNKLSIIFDITRKDSCKKEKNSEQLYILKKCGSKTIIIPYN